jgi:hypothetical protein
VKVRTVYAAECQHQNNRSDFVHFCLYHQHTSYATCDVFSPVLLFHSDVASFQLWISCVSRSSWSSDAACFQDDLIVCSFPFQ